MKNFIRILVRNSIGATAIEYGLIAALIVVASVGALTAMSSTVVVNFIETSSRVGNALNN